MDETSWNPQGLKSDPLILRYGYGVLHPIYNLFPDRPVYMVEGYFPRPAQLVSNVDGNVADVYADQMYANTGLRAKNPAESRQLAEAPIHKKGYLGYRYYQYLIPGKYEIKYHLAASGTSDMLIGRVDLVRNNARDILVKKDIYPGDTVVTLNVILDKTTFAEPRIYYSGNVRLEFKHIEITLLAANEQNQ